ncbi:Actin-related protein 2/3 complex subunit 1A [Echinococcus granulosus]|uniref:Arp2/3 complex 41 kDa subunit n=2 Tax=Echinococcus granulosus TaxID=6210 RepID=W6UTT8_ECHGR|nr:Actin-related protein 2/3 complex subunit 1A [Echinococcus granulosus]EUB61792.1 Actin-related protein 2/3 complex subunit 1A [Echinococcus granulosus]
MAISINTSNVYILSVPKSSGDRFKLVDTLKEHSALVMGIDWCATSNQIVSCSADRNAYVWKQTPDGKWKPTLVALQINRAALCVKWSPLGNKFAVGSGSKIVSVCFFEKEQDWWVPKQIRKTMKSTITCVDWHPNNTLLACGSTDYRVRVFSAFIKETDSGDSDSAWGVKSSFQTLLFEAYNGHGSWIHCVCFSADGNKLAWAGHDCSLSIAEARTGNPPVVRTIRTHYLPLLSCVWVAPNSVLGAGHDCCPILFNYYGPMKGISEGKMIDLKSESQGATKVSAFSHFQNIDRMATTDTADTRLTTIHQNSITELCIMKGNRSKALQVTSIGRDGQLVIWDMDSLPSQIAGLTIN